MLTTNDILEQTPLTSSRTLTRWHQQGILPRPKIGTHLNGKGKIAIWHDGVLERVQRICSLREQGFSLKEAVRLLDASAATPMATPETLQTEPAPLEEGIRRLEPFATGFIQELARSLGLQQDVINRLSNAFMEHGLTGDYVERAQAGFNMVLLYQDPTVLIMLPDFDVGPLLADAATRSQPYVLLPLHELRGLFPLVGWEAPKQTKYQPVTKVQRWEDNELIEYRYQNAEGELQILEDTGRVALRSLTARRDPGDGS